MQTEDVRVGMRVRITSDRSPHDGKTGTVASATEGAPVAVVLDKPDTGANDVYVYLKAADLAPAGD